MRLSKALRLGAVSAAAMLGLWTGGVVAAPMEIRIAVVGTPTQPLNILFGNSYIQNNVLTEYGKKYVVTLNKVTATPIAGQLIAAGQVDIATLSAPVLSSLLQQGILQKQEVLIVAPGVTDAYKGHEHASNFWAALKSPGIAKPEDLRGRTVALNGFGTNSDAALRTILLRHKINPDKDVKLVEVPFPNQLAALEQGRVDVAQFSTPFTEQARATGKITELFSFIQIFGGPTYNTVLVIKKATAEKNADALKSFFADFVKGVKWLQTPANRDKAVELAAETLKLPAERLKSVYLTAGDEGLDPNLCLQAAWLQLPLQQLKETGVIKEAADLKGNIDQSLLPNAGAACKAAKTR